jgi:hypothetical protein
LGKTGLWALQMLWTTWGQIFSILSCFLAREAIRASLKGEPQVQSELFDPELRFTRPCGKERTGFPQVGGAYPSEIPHPVDPEIWKRWYTLSVKPTMAFAGTELCDLYWTWPVTPTPSTSGAGL